jgi:hypothetical protein
MSSQPRKTRFHTLEPGQNFLYNEDALFSRLVEEKSLDKFLKKGVYSVPMSYTPHKKRGTKNG